MLHTIAPILLIISIISFIYFVQHTHIRFAEAYSYISIIVAIICSFMSFIYLLTENESATITERMVPLDIVLSDDEVLLKKSNGKWISDNSVRIYKAATKGDSIFIVLKYIKSYYGIPLTTDTYLTIGELK